tara:strand:+ start:164 stop:334 length:171 start_codon:yes stop_codon:yes gene_type:complete
LILLPVNRNIMENISNNTGHNKSKAIKCMGVSFSTFIVDANVPTPIKAYIAIEKHI